MSSPAAGPRAELNRDEILTDFQSCTGIEDIGEALGYLEQCNWDLVVAINNAIPQDTQTLPSERAQHHQNIGSVAQLNHMIPMINGPTERVPVGSQTSRKVDTTTTRQDAQDLLRQVPTATSATAMAAPATTSSNSHHHRAKHQADPAVPSSPPSSHNGDDSDIEDFESYQLDDDDVAEVVQPGGSSSSQRYLIPDNVSTQETGTVLFSENFTQRYGHCSPMFFHGSLESAITEANAKSAKDRRLLAVYLHHDGSVLTNVFCQHVLCSEAVVNYLALNFVVWGWDCTFDKNRELFLTSLSLSLPLAIASLRTLTTDTYPLLLLITRRGSQLELHQIIHPTATPDDLISTLIHANEMYKTQQLIEIEEEAERSARESVIKEQNRAYQESLRADMAKSEAKRLEEYKKKEEVERGKREELKKEEEKGRLKSTLPEEPGQEVDGVCTIRVRVPGGGVLGRRFLKTTNLDVLFNYLASEGYGRNGFRYLFSHPKIDLCERHTGGQKIGEIFKTQDTLIIEER